MSVEPKPRLDAATRRLDIAHAAARVIINRGMNNLRVHHVADEAGVSQPLVSQHFRSRDELIAAAFVLSDQLAFAAILDGIDSGRAGREQLDDFLDRSLRKDSEVTRSWTLWQQAWAYSSFSRELSDLIGERHSIWVSQCVDLIVAGQRDGTVPESVDAEEAAAALMAMLDGAGVSLRYDLIEGDKIRRIMARFTTEVLNGHIIG